jgi:hypothetical protein
MVRTQGEVMQTFTLQLTAADVDVLLIALIDADSGLRQAISNERQCTNNTDTIDTLQRDRTRIEGIMHQLKKQKEQQ